MNIFCAVLGGVLLLFGRRLYWLAIGVLGFLTGFELGEQWFSDEQAVLQLLVAVAAGVVGAVFAGFFQRVAFALAGFFAGGFVGLVVAGSLEFASNPTLIAFVVAGVIGAVLASLVMDWALITLTSLAGAGAVVLAFEQPPAMSGLIALALTVVGIVVQARQLESSQQEAGPN